MAYSELADKSIRLTAGILAIIGTLLLAFAVYGLHRAVFGEFHPLKEKDLSIKVINNDLEEGAMRFVGEQKMTLAAIVLLVVAAIMVTTADIIGLVEEAKHGDEGE